MRRWLPRILLGLFVLTVAGAGAGYLWLRSSLPLTEGRLALAGLQAEVRIARDAHGIPTIIAANEHDADFALGFLHAQDRLFQMDMMRRFGAGRLSEVYGERTLALDRAVRTLGLYRAAQQQYAALSPELRNVLGAYAAGVNAFLASKSSALPPEYDLLRVRPEPWAPADSLVWGKIMDLQLTGNYRGELLHARLAKRLTAEELAVLYPPYPKDAPVALENARALNGHLLDRLYALLPAASGPQPASNNWVIDGAHSSSGKPLLANDPHLDFSAPGVWYLVRIELPGLDLAGATTPGNPFLIIGHNDHIAWGFTTTGSDVEDLFIEKPDPEDAARYLTPDGSMPFLERQEEIGVRGKAPVFLTVRETRHGPLVSDIVRGQNGGPGADMLALSATWLAPDDRTPEAIWRMSHAQDWRSFRQALRDWVAPQQNIVYADTQGNIGFIAPARIPIRSKGDGWLPEPGWSGEYDWRGYVPFDALPSGFNPPSGRFVTANNKIVPDAYPYFLTRDWESWDRAERIEQLLDRPPKQSPEASAAIQADDLWLSAQRLLPLMLETTPSGPRAADALRRLRRWDFRMDRNAVEPLIFVAWLREFSRGVLADKLGPTFEDYWNLHPRVMRLILTAHREWCDPAAPPQQASCAGALSASLDRALADLERRYGAEMADWNWGRAHRAAFSSPFWSQVPVLGRWFNVAIGADGGNDTVNAGVMAISDPAAPFLDRHGPGLRMIVDLAAPGAARFIIAPGQSGNPLSPHWGDLVPAWRDMHYVTFGDDRSGGTLTLVP